MIRVGLFKATIALAFFAYYPVLAQTVDETRSLLLNPLRAISRASLSGFRDKPLFVPARTEPAAPAAVSVPVVSAPKAESPPMPPPRLALIGIVNSGHDIAIVHENDSPAATMLESGDHIDSWLVTILSPHTLRLTDGVRTVDYNLFAHEAAAPAGMAGRRPQP